MEYKLSYTWNTVFVAAGHPAMLLPMQQQPSAVLPNLLPAALLQPPMLLPMQQLPFPPGLNAVAEFLPSEPNAVADSSSALFVAGAPEDWLHPQSAQHSGLLVKRPLCGAYDDLHPHVDMAMRRFSKSELKLGYGVMRAVKNENPADLATGLHASIEALLAEAKLPEPLSKQIYDDACILGKAVGCMCPFARELEFKLEVFGENSCSRWHQDKYAGRAIVSYTGHVGTEYTSQANVDFWELNNCGNNACIIKQPDQVFAVDVGDMLFIKGTLFPCGPNGLVHRAPEKRYHSNGNIINRLVLKIDVPS